MALYGCAPAARAIPIKVYKDAGCGCCKLWVAKLEGEGFVATVEDRTDLQTLKIQLGVPDDLASCHTATVDHYVIEGQPAEAYTVWLFEDSGKRTPFAQHGA
ncbi:MAG: hypothetical protein ABL996_03045 [Micropepsaceae bacterium]